ncbi:HNH endonuclease, partial [Cyanobacteria bacterium FACHB-63]|nr:HNH endonuclease [Cyanobacteria bacterium FACHB-63]
MNHPSNGPLLRKDIHSLFDRYLLSINPDTYAIETAPDLSSTYYQTLQGGLIRLPQEKAYIPTQSALKHHYTQQGCFIVSVEKLNSAVTSLSFNFHELDRTSETSSRVSRR